MDAKVRDYRTGSLKGLKAKVEEADYERLFPKERYIGKEWLQKEYDLLWPRVWQWVCREEEIPNVKVPLQPYRKKAQNILYIFFNIFKKAFLASNIRCTFYVTNLINGFFRPGS